ncbi:MAG: hypothetical protein JWR38_5122 [Mucilaginibacter sp.]|nr:hypothetical protein [Mucilaginibacter sp.]
MIATNIVLCFAQSVSIAITESKAHDWLGFVDI